MGRHGKTPLDMGTSRTRASSWGTGSTSPAPGSATLHGGSVLPPPTPQSPAATRDGIQSPAAPPAAALEPEEAAFLAFFAFSSLAVESFPISTSAHARWLMKWRRRGAEWAWEKGDLGITLSHQPFTPWVKTASRDHDHISLDQTASMAVRHTHKRGHVAFFWGGDRGVVPHFPH